MIVSIYLVMKEEPHSVVVLKIEVLNSLMDLQTDFTFMLLDVEKIGKQSEIDISEVKRMYKILFQSSDEFDDCESFQDVLDQLSTGNHISTFSIKPLELLRRQIPKENEMMQIIELYKKKKDEFLNSTLVADFQCVVKQPKLDDPKMAKVIVRIPKYVASKRILKDIETLAEEAFGDCFKSFVHLSDLSRAESEKRRAEKETDNAVAGTVAGGVGAVVLGILFPPSLAVTVPAVAAGGTISISNANNEIDRCRSRIYIEYQRINNWDRATD